MLHCLITILHCVLHKNETQDSQIRVKFEHPFRSTWISFFFFLAWSVGVNVILEPLKNQSESWKSPGNLFLKKGTNPVLKCLYVFL